MRSIRNAALAALAMGFLPTAAAAQTDYFGMFGGYNMAQDSDWLSGGVTSTATLENGFAFGLLMGRELDSGLRVEGELGYRINEIDTVSGAPLDGRVTNLALMLNLIYEIGLDRGYSYGGAGGGAVRPYLGIGGGGALVTLDDFNDLVTTLVDDESYAYTYQFIGGIGFELTSDSVLSVDYRYIVTDNAKFTDVTATSFEADLLDWTVTIGLRTRF